MAVLTEQVLPPITVGIDVGKVHDNTAIAVAEVEQRDTGKIRFVGEQKKAYMDHRGNWHPEQGIEPVLVSHYTIRYITRLPLGMSYPDQAQALADVICSPRLMQRQVKVVLDSTGVGKPVYDDLAREIRLRRDLVLHGDVPVRPSGAQIALVPVTFVHGETYNQRTGALGKAYLVSRLQSLLQSTRVHGPQTAEMKQTLEELKVYQVKIDQDGKDTYGAMSTGTHDDLATALALAALTDPFADEVSYTKRVY